MKILILAPYPSGQAPSQRFRFELLIKSMQEKGWHFQTRSFLSMNGWKNIYKGNFIVRLFSIILGFFRRVSHLFFVPSCDLVFIHRELTPMGPPIFEFIIAKIFRKKIIYDFDDAIWLPDPNETNPLLRLIKWKSKVRKICEWSWKVSAGNEYLADFARQYCKKVEVVPTVVDTDYHVPAAEENEGITIGWTGSHTTLQYLDPLVPSLDRLGQKHGVKFAVIANKDPELSITGFEFIPWDQKREVADLQRFDIGVMPLTDDIWSQGKCGFKAIQYASIGIPAIVSPVGVNKEVVQNEVSGYWSSEAPDWEARLEMLITSKKLRKQMGQAGRAHIEANYSVNAIREKFLKLFES